VAACGDAGQATLAVAVAGWPARRSLTIGPGPVTNPKTMDDVQGRADFAANSINKSASRHLCTGARPGPYCGEQQHGRELQPLYVALPHNFKGTHMSRFVEVPAPARARVSSSRSGRLLAEMTRRLGRDHGSHRNELSRTSS